MEREKSCGCIIIDNDKVLLVQQKSGFWTFPKGHMEANETVKGTIKTVVFYVAYPIYKDCKPKEKEIKEIKWVSFKEALETITFENTRNILKDVIEKM